MILLMNLFCTIISFGHNWAPFGVLCQAENLASSSLQDGATKWLYNVVWTIHQPTHRISWKSLLEAQQCGKLGSFNVVRYLHPNCSPHQQDTSGVPSFQHIFSPTPILSPNQESMCGVPPLNRHFSCALSLPTDFCVFATLSSILDSKRCIKLALNLYLRVWHS